MGPYTKAAASALLRRLINEVSVAPARPTQMTPEDAEEANIKDGQRALETLTLKAVLDLVERS